MTELFDQKLNELKKLIEDNFNNLNSVIDQKFTELFSAVDRIVEDVTKLKMEKEFEKEQAAELSELIKQTVTEEKPTSKPAISPIIVQKPQPPVEKPPTKIEKPTTTTQKPPIIKPTQPQIIAEKAEVIPPEVHKIFDGISDAVISKVLTKELFEVMNHARDSIIKVYRWHPVLYELASFARRIQKMPENSALDNEISTLLIEKIRDWKNRILEE